MGNDQDQDTTGGTTGEPPVDDGSGTGDSGGLDGASETTAPPPDDPGDGSSDITYEWTNRMMWQAELTPAGELLVLSGDFVDEERGTMDTFSADGSALLASRVLEDRAYAFATAGQRVAMGGASAPPEDPSQDEAFFWILDSGEFIYTTTLAGVRSFIEGVAHGGDGWWTLTYQREGEDPAIDVLRRHALDGEIEAAVELPTAVGLASDAEGWAYTVSADPWVIHRISPEGDIDWSVPIPEQPLRAFTLSSWAEPGVAIVARREDERDIKILDATGQIVHEFTAPAPDIIAGPADHPPADVTDTIVMTHTHAPGGYVVEQRSLDGTLLWQVERQVPGIEILLVTDTIHHPHGAVVLGQLFMGGEEMRGFMHVVHAP